MRRIGTLIDAALAQRLCDYLLTLSIDAAAEHDADEGDAPWSIWIRNEEDVARARDEFVRFQASPDDARYQVQAEATRIRDSRVAEHQRRVSQHRETIRSLPPDRSRLGPMLTVPARQQAIPVTVGMIVISVVVSLVTDFGNPRRLQSSGQPTLAQRVMDAMSFVDREEFDRTEDPLASIRRGEVWRLVTPLFVHGDIFHLAFNMLWLFFFGSVIERLHGSLFLAALVVGTQICGMLLQALLPAADVIPEAFHGSPLAIGASGAVYGLFGYLWIRPAVDPAYPTQLVPMNIIIMLVWLVVCMTPLIDDVANGAHLGGLFAGMLAAMLGQTWKR